MSLEYNKALRRRYLIPRLMAPVVAALPAMHHWLNCGEKSAPEISGVVLDRTVTPWTAVPQVDAMGRTYHRQGKAPVAPKVGDRITG
ncbi:hypothetical protein D3C78_1590970 [compost metagenome]